MNEAGGYTLYHILCSDYEMSIGEIKMLMDNSIEYSTYTAS